MDLDGMGAICVLCGTKNSTGVRSYEDLKQQYPNGCHVCSRGTRDTPQRLKEKCDELGYDFVDMRGHPILPTPSKEKKK